MSPSYHPGEHDEIRHIRDFRFFVPFRMRVPVKEWLDDNAIKPADVRFESGQLAWTLELRTLVDATHFKLRWVG